MDPQTENPYTSPNPNPNNVYHIGGVAVEFPYKPYGSQLAFMGRVISTLERGHKQGHCHALLESPTGTGKSLSLLCSALAWQKKCRLDGLYNRLSHLKPAPEAVYDPLGHGGGFVPEPEPSGNVASGNSEPATPGKSSGKKLKPPTIYYASRTHSQITQVIREYRKTAYRVPMAVLASRKHYCTNSNIRGNANIDEECKLLFKNKDSELGCPEFKNANKVKGHPSLQKGGCHEAHDIEDLVKIGRVVKGCSYYAARSLAEDAQLVFCPYSYIVSPTIRRAMEIDLKGSIVILDEAHNIEDMARDAGSVDVEEGALFALQRELQMLCFGNPTVYQPLYDMMEGIRSWMELRKDTLVKHGFQNYHNCWTGENALNELQEAGISKQVYPILQECATKAIKEASDAESGTAHLSGISVITLEGLCCSLGYFFKGNGPYDYNLVLRKCIKRDAGCRSGDLTYSLSLWCMNPSVVFKEIADQSMSVILASGTLSPMGSFSSELGVQFENCMEAPHVIDVESQLWAAVISTGPGNQPLNASYKNADSFDFQDALGTSIEEICKVVPDGALVFFPSYKLMEKLCTRWQETGQWSRLNAQKSFFTEPRGQEDFELVLKGYYDSIRRGGGPATFKIRKGRKRDLKNADMKESMQLTGKGGSAFLAVCRGKVSEGIDFSDENARVVIVVGIPFANTFDLQVGKKKEFNEMYKSSKKLLSGSEWYCQQAFRALNQAAGRCIRHRFDYGAIILIDERFKEERNIAYISKWLRKSIRQYNSFDMSLEGLRSFFGDIKRRTEKQCVVNLEDTDKEDIIPFIKPNMLGRSTRIRKRRNRKLIEPDQSIQQKLLTKDSWSTCSISGTTCCADKKDMGNNLCSPKIESRLSETISSIVSQQVMVMETRGIYDDKSIGSSVVLSNNENSSSTIATASHEWAAPLSIHSTPLKETSRCYSFGMPVLTVTPDRIDADISNPKPEMESSFNSSVNSCSLKRRKPVSFAKVNISQMDLDGNPDAESPSAEFPRTNASRDATCRIQFSSNTDYNDFGDQNLNVQPTVALNCHDRSCFPSSVAMDKKLNICCSLCRNSLGLPGNEFLVSCSLTSSSKDYLVSFLKTKPQDPLGNGSETVSIPIVISDKTSINQRVYCKSNTEVTQEKGIWCEKEGCVFKTIFCPFCSVSNHILGLQILATDAPNTHLLNKILFYFDRLEIKNTKASTDKVILPVSDPGPGRSTNSSDPGQVSFGSKVGHKLIEEFSYLPKQETPGGWRNTKSKLKLPKRGLFLAKDDQCSDQN